MKIRLLLLPVVIMILASGCRMAPPEEDIEDRLWNSSEVAEALGSNDPWEGFNRSMFAVNKFGVLYIVRPIGWVDLRLHNAPSFYQTHRYGLQKSGISRPHVQRHVSEQMERFRGGIFAFSYQYHHRYRRTF